MWVDGWVSGSMGGLYQITNNLINLDMIDIIVILLIWVFSALGGWGWGRWVGWGVSRVTNKKSIYQFRSVQR